MLCMSTPKIEEHRQVKSEKIKKTIHQEHVKQKFCFCDIEGEKIDLKAKNNIKVKEDYYITAMF